MQYSTTCRQSACDSFYHSMYFIPIQCIIRKNLAADYRQKKEILQDLHEVNHCFKCLSDVKNLTDESFDISLRDLFIAIEYSLLFALNNNGYIHSLILEHALVYRSQRCITRYRTLAHHNVGKDLNLVLCTAFGIGNLDTENTVGGIINKCSQPVTGF